ncbi:MAG: exo-alpha-sialidase [Methanobacteriota archaeon]|nr:MAG: exo-alpha-sialidase [Euryarchaeota archaeon]
MILANRKNLNIALVSAVVLSTIMAIAASPATARNVKWQEPVVMAGPGDYQCLDLVTGVNGVYVLTHEYPAGRVLLFKSLDGGSTWNAPVNVFEMPIWAAYPGMCVYQEGDEDTILVASGPNYVAKSTDSGATFVRLTDVPKPASYDTWYCSSAIGTNASWFGGEADSDIYFVSGYYMGIPWTGKYVLHFSKSCDGGSSWTEPVVVSTMDYSSIWPEVFSDGERLYTLHAVPYNFNVHLKYSDDWGATWTDGGDLATSEGGGGLLALKVQPIDHRKAFVTLWDVQLGTGFARCGYFEYDDMAFTDTFRVENPEWRFAMHGLNVEKVGPSGFRIAGIDRAADDTHTVMFANSWTLDSSD